MNIKNKCIILWKALCNSDDRFLLLSSLSLFKDMNDEECLKIYNETIAREKWAYNTISNKLKEKYISNGMSEIKAEKKAIEDARFVLPNACETKMIVTMNIRSLYNFFTLRCCNNAQWEIRNVANEMLKICKEVSPTLFKKAGASCTRGKCPEGNKSCGKPIPIIN